MDISVIIPCHNAEKYLAQTLGSLMDQTRLPEEILIVDDGSTDGSMHIARLFESAAGGRIRVYAHRAASAAKTRSIGAELARGDLLMFLDADDVLDPLVLEGLSESLYDEPAGVAVSRWKRLEFQKGQWVSRPPSCRPWSNRFDKIGNWLRGWYHPTSTVLWTRRAFTDTGGWDSAVAVNQDGDLMMRAFLNETPLFCARKGTCYYRRLPQETMSVSGKRMTKWGVVSRLYVIEKIGYRLARQNRIDTYRSSIGEALLQILLECDGRSEEIICRIEDSYRVYGPTFPYWAARRRDRFFKSSQNLVRKMRDAFYAAENRSDSDLVSYGMERAKRILESGLAVNSNDQKQPLPLRPRRPSVTVIIPTYNRAITLRRAINSVLAQTHSDFELLVIDDGSTDNTASLMREITDPRIRYIRQNRNQGVSAARNRGLREAKGDFIAFLDSDDEWMPEKLERQMDLFTQVPEKVGLIYTGVEIISENGGRSTQLPSYRGDVYRKLLLRNIITGGGSTAMIRRKVIAVIGFFDESLPAIEDYDYWLRLSRFFRVDFVPEILMRYHTPPLLQRKSLDIKDNIKSREEFFQRYGRQMRRAGVAHLFLLDSAGRHLAPGLRDRVTARRLALEAAFQRPFSHASLYYMLYTLFPCALLVHLRNWRYRHLRG